MKYHTLFVILKKLQNLKLSSTANYRWRFMGYDGFSRGVASIISTSSFTLSNCRLGKGTPVSLETKHFFSNNQFFHKQQDKRPAIV